VKERKFPIILFSLIFAFLVWISINLGNQFQTIIDVPVRIENLRQDLSIALPLPNTVHFKVRGTGWQLLNTLISPNLSYVIDFTAIPKNDLVITAKELNEHVNFANNINIIETFPETIVVRLDDKVTKKVPIIGIVNASFREGFGIVGTIKTNPDSVVLTGARSLLSKIRDWRTETILLNDINIPISLNTTLKDSLQFEISRSISNTLINFDVQPIAEKTINEIPIEIVQIPDKRNVLLIPPKISIIIRSGVNNIANLSEKNFYVFVDYKSILLDTSGMIQPTIVGPDNVKIVQQNPEKIQYVVRK
jgi:YbbR domain-containing protein